MLQILDCLVNRVREGVESPCIVSWPRLARATQRIWEGGNDDRALLSCSSLLVGLRVSVDVKSVVDGAG